MFTACNEQLHHHKLQLLIRFALREGWQVRGDGDTLELVKAGLPPIFTTHRYPLSTQPVVSVRCSGGLIYD